MVFTADYLEIQDLSYKNQQKGKGTLKEAYFNAKITRHQTNNLRKMDQTKLFSISLQYRLAKNQDDCSIYFSFQGKQNAAFISYNVEFQTKSQSKSKLKKTTDIELKQTFQTFRSVWEQFQGLIIIKYYKAMTDRRFVNHQHLGAEGGRLKVQCRFCRHKEEYNRFSHVAPCGCIGATRFVHQSCLQTWSTVKFQHVYNQPYEGDPLQFNVFCQMCQQKMEIEFSLTKKCSKYDQFLQKLQEDKLVFVIVLLLAIISISMLVFIIIFSSISYINGNLLAIVIAICLITLTADLTFFCRKFMLIKSIDIEKVGNHKDPPKLLAFAQQDINNIQHQSSLREDPHFGQALSRTNPVDQSLMLESKRNSGSEKGSSVESKALTDIVMMKMYEHDLPSQRQMPSNEIQKENLSKRGKPPTLNYKSRHEKQIKEESQQKQYAQQSIQVTVFQEKKQLSGKSKTDIQRQDKSIQMSNNERSDQVDSQRSKRRKCVKKIESQSFQAQNKNQKNRKIEYIKQEEQSKSIEQKQIPKFSPINREQQMQVRRYNVIKQKDFSEQEQLRPTVKKTELVKQPINKQPKLKLKNPKDPIKIKIKF